MAPALPRLILVTGPPGSGKTTLAHELARTIGCPVISRDEIKEGTVLTAARAPHSDPVTNLAATQAFVTVLRTLLEREVSVVAEAAFQHELWSFVLDQLDGLADLAVVRCRADDAVLRGRLVARPARSAHDDDEHLAQLDERLATFDPIHVDAPTIDVDTTDGLAPTLSELAQVIIRV